LILSLLEAEIGIMREGQGEGVEEGGVGERGKEKRNKE
jgi:hypothetical protein